MRISKARTGLAGALLALLLLLQVLPVFAAENTPRDVVNSRDGVFRIVVTDEYSWGTGSGFAVGTPEETYIVTNYHVSSAGENIFIVYNTGEYVTATVVSESPFRDIAILKADGEIPGLKVLPLETGEIDSGMAVYALGYSGASDLLARGFVEEDYADDEEILGSVIADKQSMSITDGIISAVINSSLVSEVPDSGSTAKLIQTNTAINQGNSGGPLLDSYGNVVGINTLGLSGMEWHIEAVNGSVHVDELIRELRGAGIEFTTAPQQQITLTPLETPEKSVSPLPFILMGVVAVAAIVLIILLLRRNAANETGSGTQTLSEFEKAGRSLPPATVAAWVGGWLREIGGGPAGNLLRPDNILIGAGRITFKDRKTQPGSADKINIYPGYSAPENYRNRADDRADVYFVGAMMSTLLTGHRPDDAISRQESKKPLFAQPNTLQSIINTAAGIEENSRYAGLSQMLYALDSQSQRIQMESGGYSQAAALLGQGAYR